MSNWWRKKKVEEIDKCELRDFYLDKGIRDSSRWKRASSNKIDEWITKNVGELPKMTYGMLDHQRRCYCLGLIYPRFYMQLDMGTGKTKLAIDLFNTRWEREQVERMLVLVPGKLNLDQWREQVAEHSPSLRVILGNRGTKRLIQDVAERDFDVVVMTYQALLSVYRDAKRARAFVRNFDFLVPDESSIYKNHGGAMFGMMRKLRKEFHYILNLSGTPFSKDPIGLWAQFYILDGGDLLGSSISEYRRRFFHEKTFKKWTKWEIIPDKIALLNRVIHHLAIRYAVDDCLDLDPALRREVSVPMTPEQLEFWADIQQRKALCVAFDESVAWTAHEERMCSSGFKILEDGTAIPFEKNPKLEALCDLIDEIEKVMGEDESVIIVHHYVVTGNMIVDALKREKVKVAQVNGKLSDSAKSKAIADFKAKRARVLVANSAAAYGLNLQDVCRSMIFFEPLDNAEHREQIERRIWRQGQTKKVYYFDLTLRASSDDKALARLQTKKNLIRRVVDGKGAKRSGVVRIDREQT
jgi:SNF2 family DNA or RNA helicase